MASYTAGDFTAFDMLDIKAIETEMFPDPRSNRDVNTDATLAIAVGEKQRVRLPSDIKDQQYCGQLDVAALNSHQLTVETVLATDEESCDITGTEIGAVTKTFQPNTRMRVKYAVAEDDCRSRAEVKEKLALAQMTAKRKLEAELSKKIIAVIDANNANPYLGEIEGATVDGVNVYLDIPDAQFNSSIIAEFSRMAALNGFVDPYLISGQNLWTANFLAQYQSAGCCNTDTLFGAGLFDLYFDHVHLDTVLSRKSTFMIDPGALFFYSSNRFKTPAPIERPNKIFESYEVAPRVKFFDGTGLQDLIMDHSMQYKCVAGATGGGRRTYAWHGEYNLTVGIHAGFTDANDGTGIIEFHRNCTSCGT